MLLYATVLALVSTHRGCMHWQHMKHCMHADAAVSVRDTEQDSLSSEQLTAKHCNMQYVQQLLRAQHVLASLLHAQWRLLASSRCTYAAALHVLN